MKKGTLYGISVGPGDPELLTLKAVRLLEQCPVIAAPETGDGSTLALDIAAQAVELSEKMILRVQFPMTRDEVRTRENHHVQAQKLMAFLEAGQDVAMLNLGDVSVYSTFCYLMEIIRAEGFAVEMIPGVTSFCAVAAKLGTSLTEKSLPLHIIPAGYPGVDACLDLPGTKVLMKPRKAAAPLLEVLQEKGLLSASAMVQNCGLPEEQVWQDLSQYQDSETGYFTTVVVKTK